MVSIVALGAVTVGINLVVSHSELRELGIMPGDCLCVSVEQMEAFHIALEKRYGTLPSPRSGGSVGNTADLLARAGLSCGMMGMGGNDNFGRTFVSNCEKASLVFLSKLEDKAVTGYDFYLFDNDTEGATILTQGANALLSPERIDFERVKGSELVLLDGFALSFGPESEAAMSRCAEAAEAAGVPVVLTLASTTTIKNHRAFYDTFGPKAQMLVGNLTQATELVGLEAGASLDSVEKELMKTDMDAVITLDAEGAFARFGEETFFCPTQKQVAIDSTGAGDAFLAAFLVAIRKGISVSKALAVANTISGEVIQYEGARLPIDVDVPELIQKAIHSVET